MQDVDILCLLDTTNIGMGTHAGEVPRGGEHKMLGTWGSSKGTEFCAGSKSLVWHLTGGME